MIKKLLNEVVVDHVRFKNIDEENVSVTNKMQYMCRPINDSNGNSYRVAFVGVTYHCG